jgi:hypothetical protein
MAGPVRRHNEASGTRASARSSNSHPVPATAHTQSASPAARGQRTSTQATPVPVGRVTTRTPANRTVSRLVQLRERRLHCTASTVANHSMSGQDQDDERKGELILDINLEF